MFGSGSFWDRSPIYKCVNIQMCEYASVYIQVLDIQVCELLQVLAKANIKKGFEK